MCVCVCLCVFVRWGDGGGGGGGLQLSTSRYLRSGLHKHGKTENRRERGERKVY